MSETTRPKLSQLVREAMESRLAELHVSMPCSIISYDAAKQTANLRPLLKRKRRFKDGTTKSADIPTLQNVPVSFPRCAGGWVTFPLAKGDLGMVIFAERSLADWMGKDGSNTVDVSDETLHPFSGAWFVPGGYPEKNPLTGGADDVNVVIHAEERLDLGEKGLNDADHLVALAKNTKAEIKALRDYVATHVHGSVVTSVVPAAGPGVTGGTGVVGSSGAPTSSPPTVGDVKATKTRAK